MAELCTHKPTLSPLGLPNTIEGLVSWNSNCQFPLMFAIKENELPFSVPFAANKWKFAFPFSVAGNKRKLPFSISSVFCLRNSGNTETWTWRHEGMKACRHADMQKWKLGDMETWRHWHGDMDMKTWNYKKTNGKGKPRRFFSIRLPFAHVANGSFWVFSVYGQRNKRKFSVCKRTKQTCPSLPHTWTQLYWRQVKNFSRWQARAWYSGRLLLIYKLAFELLTSERI